MAVTRWYFIQFLPHPSGWMSPPALESYVQAKTLLQTRFDTVTGVALVKSRAASPLPVGTEIDPQGPAITDWLVTIPRLPKPAGPGVPPTEWYTVEEELKMIRALAKDFY